MSAYNALLDAPAYPAQGFAPLADRIAALFKTQNDVLLIQAEAILALEAAALSIARPGLRAVNVITSFYGGYFSTWLRRGGVDVADVIAEPGQPIAAEAVARAMRGGADILVAVHGEAANGVLNPLADLAEIAHRAGALFVVDAVSSVGAHEVPIDALNIDVAAIGMQKALGGPTGVSMLTVSPWAWDHIARTPDFAPSSLSLMDLKRRWLDAGRGALPGSPAPLEFWALDAALTRIEAEGMPHLIARHQRAMRATRAGLRGLGLTPPVADAAACGLITAAPIPAGLTDVRILRETGRFASTVSAGVGPGAEGRLLRLGHYGANAAMGPVLANIAALGQALLALGQPVALAEGLAAAAETFGRDSQ